MPRVGKEVACGHASTDHSYLSPHPNLPSQALSRGGQGHFENNIKKAGGRDYTSRPIRFKSS